MSRRVSLNIQFHDLLEPGAFFDDWSVNAHKDATDEECAEAARAYIEQHGILKFVNDWNVGEFDVHVGGLAVAKDGQAVAQRRVP